MAIIYLGLQLLAGSSEALFLLGQIRRLSKKFLLAPNKDLAVSPPRFLLGLAKHTINYMLGVLALSRSAVSVRTSHLTVDGC